MTAESDDARPRTRPEPRPAAAGRGGGPASRRALSGRPTGEATLEAAVRGDLLPADLRIHPETLRDQAAVAEQHGNPQLGENLRRAAELAVLPDDEVLAIYEALRPGRSSRAELDAVARRLETCGAPLCARLVREATAAYERRGVLRDGSRDE